MTETELGLPWKFVNEIKMELEGITEQDVAESRFPRQGGE